MHGFIIYLTGNYTVEGRVMWKFEGGDMYEFLSRIFDIKFTEEVLTIEEAKKYVYDNKFDNLYMEDNYIWLKIRVDMRKIISRTIGEIGEDYFVVYNKYYKGFPVECGFDLDNIFEIQQNLNSQIEYSLSQQQIIHEVIDLEYSESSNKLKHSIRDIHFESNKRLRE